MLTQENISIAIQIFTLFGIVFGVYFYLRRPQEKGEITDALFAERFTQFDRELANLRDNHIHTIETKLSKHIEDNNNSNIKTVENFAKLFTLIEERLPRK